MTSALYASDHIEWIFSNSPKANFNRQFIFIKTNTTIAHFRFVSQAEIVHLRSEIVDMKVQNELLEKEMHSLLVQLHADQLDRLHLVYPEQKENIKDKLQRDLAESSPIRSSCKWSS